LSGFALNSGGYECYCSGGFRYPQDFEGPYKGIHLIDVNNRKYPLCIKSEALLQFPNWINRYNPDNSYDRTFGGTDYIYNNYRYSPLSDIYYSLNRGSDNFVINLDRNDPDVNYDHLIFPYRNRYRNRRKRFLDRRNAFEKLRDSIYSANEYKRQCYSMYQDILRLHDDDERYVLNLRYHANDVFKPQMAQAVRIAHIISSYLQLHVPIGTTSSAGNQYDSFNVFSNKVGNKMRPDPQLDERIIIAEIMSTLYAQYPLLEVNVFFNGTEYNRQKLFATQNTLAFGLTGFKTGSEILLNRSNDDSHLTKSWYKDAISRYTFAAQGTFGGAGAFQPENEKNFYTNPNSFELNSLTYRIDRYSIEMNLRKSFDGLTGSTDLPVKFYDAASSGVWFGPYYDCQKVTNKPQSIVRMSYSVPIMTGTSKPPV